MGPSGRFTHVIVILMFGTGYMQVLYLGRAPRTKETMPDFREKCRVTRHSRVFRGLTGSQRTPGFWGVTLSIFNSNVIGFYFIMRIYYRYSRFIFIKISYFLWTYTNLIRFYDTPPPLLAGGVSATPQNLQPLLPTTRESCEAKPCCLLKTRKQIFFLF